MMQEKKSNVRISFTTNNVKRSEVVLSGEVKGEKLESLPNSKLPRSLHEREGAKQAPLSQRNKLREGECIRPPGMMRK
jgi:hypothetical protein